MSRQFRYRVAAVVLSGLVFGAPLLINGTASAEQLDPRDRRVSFTGNGVLGLTCESRPTVESMRVPADSVVQVQNRTGHDARLMLGGTEKGVIPEDGSADVVFRRGTTTVLLTPDCDHGDDAVPMIVTAEPSASSRPGPAPAPTGGSTSAHKSKPSGSASRTSNSTRTKAAKAASRPARTGPNSTRTGLRKPSGARPAAAASSAAAAAAMPPGDAGQRLKARIVRGTPGVGAPAFAGMPVDAPKTEEPGTSAVTPAVPHSESVAPAVDGVPVETDDAPVSASASAAEPVAAVGPIREGRPVGLLGLTALVCVLGVTTAAIRAFVSQRASHANMP